MMIMNRLSFFIGKRTIKTALSVFITSFVCQWLHWPVIFAVLAALVSIEPTVNASIRKAKVRLPAAVVGAAFAMLFVWLFGQTPLAYSLSVLFTIAVCHRLRWEDAIVVAALTSLNMLVLTEDHFLKNFFIRVGTTSLGIVVSVVVNYLVFPPHFAGLIQQCQPKLLELSQNMMKNIMKWHLDGIGNEEKLKEDYTQLLKRVDKAEYLVQYQFEEFHYHRFKLKEYREMHILQKQLEYLRQILLHVGALVHMENRRQELTEDEKVLLWGACSEIEQYFNHSLQGKNFDHHQLNKKMIQIKSLMLDKNDVESHPLLDFRSTLAYELLAIYNVVQKREQQQLKLEHMKEHCSYSFGHNLKF